MRTTRRIDLRSAGQRHHADGASCRRGPSYTSAHAQVPSGQKPSEKNDPRKRRLDRGLRPRRLGCGEAGVCHTGGEANGDSQLRLQHPLNAAASVAGVVLIRVFTKRVAAVSAFSRCTRWWCWCAYGSVNAVAGGSFVIAGRARAGRGRQNSGCNSKRRNNCRDGRDDADEHAAKAPIDCYVSTSPVPLEIWTLSHGQ